MILSEAQIKAKMPSLPTWATDGKQITKTYQFKDFVAAIRFVNALVEPAENAGHHPDISISYNKVSISLTSHDAGGITEKDFDLGAKIAEIAAKFN